MVEVGDKVRVTTGEYDIDCPRGTICTVFGDYGGGDIWAVIDGGDGFDWFLKRHQYEPIGIEETEYNYAEQAAKYGIKITINLVNGDVISFDGTK